MPELVQDIRFALRSFGRRPGFLIGSVLTMALGLGATTAIFTVFHSVVLKPLPYRSPNRLFMLWETSPESPEPIPVTASDFLDWRQPRDAFVDLTAYSESTRNLTLSGAGEPQSVVGVSVFGNLFSVMGEIPLLGRGLREEDSVAGSPPAVTLSHQLWARLGAEPDIVGQKLVLDGIPYTVVGVMPRGFDFPLPGLDLWLPIKWSLSGARPSHFRLAHNLRVVGRSRPGVSAEKARASVGLIATRLSQEQPDSNRSIRAGLTRLDDWIVGNRRLPLLLLLGAVGGLLLIACTNVASLQLARAAARGREIALRQALGAGRGRIVQQLLAESLTLSCLGCLVGLPLGLWGIRLLISLSPGDLPRVEDVGLSPAVFLFAFALTLVATLATGLAPALHLLKASGDALRDMSKESSGSNRRSVRSAMLVAEVALALVLAISSGLLLKSFYVLQQVSPGFEPRNVLTALLPLPLRLYSEPKLRAFQKQLLERAGSLPGVKSAALVDGLPLRSLRWTGSLRVEGRPQSRPEMEFHHRVVSPDYFEALGVPLRSGRFFTETDDAGAPRVALVNEALVRRAFAGRDPVGQRISFLDEGGEPSGWITIVGVVGDERIESLAVKPRPEIFASYLQDPQWSTTLVVRTDPGQSRVAGELLTALRDLDRNLPLPTIEPMEHVLSGSLVRQRFLALLTSVFAALALLLALVGIYSLTAYLVAQRTREIGIRISLGASGWQILELLTWGTMRLVVAGIALGLAGAAAVSRTLRHVLFEVSALDATTYLAMTLALAFAALLASALPARRATRVDPATSLRGDA